MKNDSNFAKRFSTLFRKIRAKHKAQPPEPLNPIGQLVLGFLQWNTSSKQADTGYGRLIESMVDLNELRVSHSYQVMEVLGNRYPMAQERCMRMRESLQDIFHREHGMNLDRLATMPKKEVRVYLDTLGGMTPYVSAQVTLLCFGGYALPVDDSLKNLLVSEGAADPNASLEQVESFLQRQIKAADALDAHANLRAWTDAAGRKRQSSNPPKTAAKSTKRPAAARSSAKTTSARKSTGKKKSTAKSKR